MRSGSTRRERDNTQGLFRPDVPGERVLGTLSLRCEEVYSWIPSIVIVVGWRVTKACEQFDSWIIQYRDGNGVAGTHRGGNRSVTQCVCVAGVVMFCMS